MLGGIPAAVGEIQSADERQGFRQSHPLQQPESPAVGGGRARLHDGRYQGQGRSGGERREQKIHREAAGERAAAPAKREAAFQREQQREQRGGCG